MSRINRTSILVCCRGWGDSGENCPITRIATKHSSNCSVIDTHIKIFKGYGFWTLDALSDELLTVIEGELNSEKLYDYLIICLDKYISYVMHLSH